MTYSSTWLLSILLSLATCGDVWVRGEQQLLVVSFPGPEAHTYYIPALREGGSTLQHLADFYREYARRAAEVGDQFMLMYQPPSQYIDESSFPSTTHFLRVSRWQDQDIWMRDFATVTPDIGAKFRYRPRYLSSSDARWVERQYIRLVQSVGEWRETPRQMRLVLDGGNVVDSPGGRLVVSRRVRAENRRRSVTSIKNMIQRVLPGKEVCLIPDPGADDTTGHADGILAFINDTTVLLTDFGDQEYYTRNVRAVQGCWPDVDIYSIPYDMDGDGTDPVSEFTSAVGSYVNMVLTDLAIYLPSFHVPGRLDYATQDEAARTLVSQLATGAGRRVVMVNAGRIAHMGGSVRCLTWQLYVSHPTARALIARAQGGK